MILNLRGGFGNQCIQLSQFKSVDELDGLRVNIYSSNLAPPFVGALKEKAFSSLACHLLGGGLRKILSVMARSQKDLDGSFLKDGYWQYGEVPSVFPLWVANSIKKHLVDVSEEPVVMHVRGGDYLNNKSLATYVSLDEEYYRNALEELLESGVDISRVVVVTNDLDAVSNVLEDLQGHFDGIGFEVAPRGMWEDFSLLYASQNCICANSSFSLAARILRNTHSRNGRTVYPSPWFKARTYEDPVYKDFHPVLVRYERAE
ncbi:alpha-1,2-fucosyltransferase [Agaribacterium haliotis]|uniref:alpha-1,2-fucosyltransferase n=1 Tax=Agaribacterium haliotis TaxID=2013869 RepID=UPI000BB583DE|nr:alpha-1,2-fucosyltransferase [Agaribacterium haliotis]